MYVRIDSDGQTRTHNMHSQYPSWCHWNQRNQIFGFECVARIPNVNNEKKPNSTNSRNFEFDFNIQHRLNSQLKQMTLFFVVVVVTFIEDMVFHFMILSANVNVQLNTWLNFMYVFYLNFQLTKRLVTSISYHIQARRRKKANKQTEHTEELL